ncbi:MAG: PEGA domain-containing protein [bacterium]
MNIFVNNKRLPALVIISSILILILGGLIAYQYWYLPKQTTLFFQTEPSEATVYIDGKQVGKTPYEQDIWKGEHTIKLEKDDLVYEETENYDQLMYSINRVLTE